MILSLILLFLAIYGLAILDRIQLDKLRKEWDSWQGNEEWNG